VVSKQSAVLEWSVNSQLYLVVSKQSAVLKVIGDSIGPNPLHKYDSSIFFDKVITLLVHV